MLADYGIKDNFGSYSVVALPLLVREDLEKE